MGHEVPAAIFDLDEAVETVADGLRDEAQARLTYDEVRTMLVAAIGHLHNKGLSALPGEEISLDADQDVTVVDDEAVAVVLGAVDTAKLDVTDEDAYAVLDGLLGYLRHIGALGPRAEP
ncbi:MAG TPA: hypothetical protein VIR58_07880 [Acidimicrobiales bacterium]